MSGAVVVAATVAAPQAAAPVRGAGAAAADLMSIVRGRATIDLGIVMANEDRHFLTVRECMKRTHLTPSSPLYDLIFKTC